MDGPLTAALLIVSTTAAKDPSTDASGPVLTDVLKAQGDGKWEVKETKIVTDDVFHIHRAVRAWTDGEDRVNLIVTTGGTGFAVSDKTPEVGIRLSLLRVQLTYHLGYYTVATQASTRSSSRNASRFSLSNSLSVISHSSHRSH